MEKHNEFFIDFANGAPFLIKPNKINLKDPDDVRRKLVLLLDEIIQRGEIPGIGDFKSVKFITSEQKVVENQLKTVEVEKDLLWYQPEFFVRVAESFHAFLSDRGNLSRLRHCQNCNMFFLKTRDDERERFCSGGCRNSYNEKSRKTEAGRSSRAKYMVKHRKDLKAKKGRALKKKTISELKKQVERENAVAEAWDTLKESLKPEIWR